MPAASEEVPAERLFLLFCLFFPVFDFLFFFGRDDFSFSVNWFVLRSELVSFVVSSLYVVLGLLSLRGRVGEEGVIIGCCD